MYAFGLQGAAPGLTRDIILADSTIEVLETRNIVDIIANSQVVDVIAVSNIVDILETSSVVDILEASSIVDIVQTNPVIEILSDLINVIIPGAGDLSSVRVNITLGENVSQYKAIAALSGLGFLADKDTLSHTDAVIGLSVTSGITTQVIEVQTGDEITEGSWSWDTTKPIFLGNSGVLTQTVATTGFIQRIAKPLTATTIMIDIDDPIVLA